MEEKAKILVVDDEVKICRNVEKILGKDDYDVSWASSADEALEKMAKESYKLLISDIIMPGMNGLEFLKLVKNQWPLTKVIMFTAYASTDTAVKAMRLGAVDYIPKPFTPDELRLPVELAMTGELTEASPTEQEMEAINVIDIDTPFDTDEVAKYTDEDYAKSVSRSDIPIAGGPSPELLENYCELGAMVCEIFQKVGGTCKGGLKTGKCPQIEARKKKAAKQKQEQGFDPDRLIGIDMPFDYEEVAAITGPEYVQYLDRDGYAFLPYEQLKKNAAQFLATEPEPAAIPLEVAAEAPRQDILVIEDEVAVNNNIRKILAKKGYQVDQAVTKDEALQKIEQTSYKLVLLDLKIPGVKGLELLRAVREKRPESMVVIITGYASIETAKETARLGAVAYLPKPFTPTEIRDVTESAVKLAA
ncbi:MAG: response regulator [Deltaproteobacteria bacterium]|nr:MAG: response regulator [Deltaproteobacteria bacterium]